MTDVPASSLARRRILVVEDEYWVASELAVALRRAGAEVVGPVGTMSDAESLLIGEPLDGAVLDMNLHGDHAFALADQIQSAGVPLVIATGYGGEALPEALRDIPRLQKPFGPKELVDLLPAVFSRAGR